MHICALIMESVYLAFLKKFWYWFNKVNNITRLTEPLVEIIWQALLYLGSNIHGYCYHPNSKNNILLKPVRLAPSAFIPQKFIKHLLFWSGRCSIAQNIKKKKILATGNLRGSIHLELCYFIYVKMVFMKYK